MTKYWLVVAITKLGCSASANKYVFVKYCILFGEAMTFYPL